MPCVLASRSRFGLRCDRHIKKRILKGVQSALSIIPDVLLALMALSVALSVARETRNPPRIMLIESRKGGWVASSFAVMKSGKFFDNTHLCPDTLHTEARPTL